MPEGRGLSPYKLMNRLPDGGGVQRKDREQGILGERVAIMAGRSLAYLSTVLVCKYSI